MVKVNVAALKAELSRYLDMAQQGEQIIVTSHGEEIAKIGPAQMVTSAAVNWKEFIAKHPSIKPSKKPSKKKEASAAKLIRQIRDEE